VLATRSSRNNAWSALLLVAMLGAGFCVIGYWKTYDLSCLYGTEWKWSTFPPQFVCRQV
jgi:hypothetical protein